MSSLQNVYTLHCVNMLYKVLKFNKKSKSTGSIFKLILITNKYEFAKLFGKRLSM